MTRDIPEENVIHIPISRWKLFLMILVSIVFTGLGLWLFIAGPGIYHFTPFLARSTGLLAFIMFGLMGFFLIRRFVMRSPGLEINQEGIVDNTHKSRRIEWSDITKLEKYETFGSEFILVVVKNPEFYMKNADFFQRIFMGWNYRSYGTPLTLSSGFLNCSFNELYDKLNRGLLNYHIRKNNT